MVQHARTLILPLTFALAFVRPGFAQSVTATISGTVKDSTGAVIPGLDVSALNQHTGIVRSTVTNEAGFYSIPKLIIGTYTVSAAIRGFKKPRRCSR